MEELIKQRLNGLKAEKLSILETLNSYVCRNPPSHIEDRRKYLQMRLIEINMLIGIYQDQIGGVADAI